jgi:hypothetical protein
MLRDNVANRKRSADVKTHSAVASPTDYPIKVKVAPRRSTRRRRRIMCEMSTNCCKKPTSVTCTNQPIIVERLARLASRAFAAFFWFPMA